MPRQWACAGVTILLSAFGLAAAAPLCAQSLEIAPITGFRGGGAQVLTAPGVTVDRGTSPALGAIVDVPLSNDGLQFEAAFSHQKIEGQTTDHWQVGGLQEFLPGRARPFATGVLGLTRYGVGGSNEVRFTVGAGGGVKFLASSRVGVRVDGRLFATLLDAQGSAVVCGAGPCFISLHVHVAWQGEFTAGLVVRFP
jgi:hypothetical protein